MSDTEFPRIQSDGISLSQSEFYDCRDDRTLRVTDLDDYRNATVLITGQADRLETFAGQVSLLTAANTISRFSRNIDIDIPQIEIHPELRADAASIPDQCDLEMTAADPFGCFDCDSGRHKNSYDVAVVLGETTVNAKETVCFDGRGWLARISRNKPLKGFGDDPLHPVGPGVAGSYAAAEAFKVITSDSERDSTAYTFDAYNLQVHQNLETVPELPSLPESLDLGAIHLVGAGAVASGMVYFARHLPLDCELTIIDNDTVEYSNLNRTPLFTAHDAAHEIPKVSVIQRFLPGSVTTSTHQQWYHEFIEEHGPGTPDIILPLADEHGVRATIQHNYPPVLVQSNTGGWSVNVRRSIPVSDPCLLCHFPPESPDPTYGCATGPIGSDSASHDDEIHGALPFTTPLAGALLTGELLKLTFDEYPVRENNVLIGVKSPDTLPTAVSRRADCGFCNHLNERIYLDRVKDSRFTHLTRNS